MPPLPLTSLLQTALPGLSRVSRAVVSTLACRNGAAPSANEIAVSVGLHDRHQLARRLRHDGLPPLEQLAGWTRVLYWILEAESTKASLLQLARRDRLDPATAYRLVRRLTGQRWSEVRGAGLTAVLVQLRQQREAPAFIGLGGEQRRESAAAGLPALTCPGPELSATLVQARSSAPGHPEVVLTTRLPLSGGPFDVAIARSGIACVTRCRAAAIDCLDLSPLRVTASVRTGVAPTRVIVSPTGEEAYVTNQFTEDVTFIDLRRCRPISAVIVPGHALGAALSPDARTLYVTTNADRLCAISVRARRVVAWVPVPPGCSGCGLGVHPSGRWVYVPTGRAGLIVEVDVHTLQPKRRFEVGGAPQDLTVSTDGAMLYSTNQRGWLDAIHLAAGRVARVHFGTAAFSVALSPDETVVYVGLQFAGRVVQVNPATLQVLGSFETGGRPRRIAFHPSGHFALLANEAGWVDRVG